ncbi:MAG: polysaccharide biosynthesis tyrosine autokinase [Thermoguttaceae bacterium]|jgi:capsular exopolysaccharide synthesis family protein
MSIDERPLSEEQSNIQALTLNQASTLSQPAGSVARYSQDVAVQSGAPPEFTTYLHAIRRNWLLATALGVCFGIAAGLAVWFMMGDRYTAEAYIQLHYQKENMVFTSNNMTVETEYELFKNTQMQYVSSNFVLAAALHRPEDNPISRLPILKNQRDPIQWLMKKLSVSFPQKGEFMKVEVTTSNAEEANKIVAAVVDAYRSEVVDSEMKKRRDRVDELERLYTEKDQEVRNRRGDLKLLAEQLGAAETENLNLKQKLTLEELALYRNQSAQRDFEIGRLRSDLGARQAELKAVQNLDVSETECEMYAQNDPVLRDLMQEIMWRQEDSQNASGVLKDSGQKDGAKKPNRFIEQYQGQLDRFKNEYNDRIEKIKAEIIHKRQTEVDKEIKRLEAAIEIANKQQKVIEEEVQHLKKQAEQFGSSSVDVEMLRADIAVRVKSLDSIESERDKLKVELRSPPRIEISKQPPAPVQPSNTMFRTSATVFASLLGLLLPMAAITLWDSRHQRINSSAEVRERLGIPVIGAMPIIPARVLRHLGSPSKKNQLWQLRLTESVDGITARLLRRAELEQRRVLMVTSAVSGEGKTTLAAQLAMSLARAGRRTVLVDFDLRQPSFDDAFGLERSPGVSEILRNESDLARAIQHTQTGNLSVITAGRWNRMALSALANGGADSLFKELRDEYDFVVVDTSPILPIADARFVSQYVDSVVLCVFRDISEAPRIRAACEILEAFGVQCVEAAVAGASEKDSSRSGYYHSSVSA